MAEAIAYVWLTEKTYDKDYVAAHTFGFEEWKRHILGKRGGTPKTPRWAENICGVPAESHHGPGEGMGFQEDHAESLLSGRRRLPAGLCNGVGKADGLTCKPCRGWGKPGVNIWSTAHGGPFNAKFTFPGYSFFGIDKYAKRSIARQTLRNPVSQRIYRPLFADAILNPPIRWLFEAKRGTSLDQFHPFTYPEEGKSECHMFYRHGGSFIGTMLETNKWVKALRKPQAGVHRRPGLLVEQRNEVRGCDSAGLHEP